MFNPYVTHIKPVQQQASRPEPSPFGLGDVVRQKSGGPVMTVTNLLPNAIQCNWFDDAGELHVAAFPAGELEKVQRDSSG
jgi:uncharacterized protein YodC (DUF2158 family)